jgi:hypothetical protein
MFIAANRKFKLRRADGSVFLIPNGFVGDIPKDVADQWIIKAAIEDGSIVCSKDHSDKAVEGAISKGKAKVTKAAKAKEGK